MMPCALLLAAVASPTPSRTTVDPTQTEGPTTTASLDDGFGVHSADGRFGLTAGFLGWLRYGVAVTGAQTSHGFGLPLARPTLRARLWGNRLSLLLQPELAGSPRLLDATATVTLHPAFAVEAGQYRPWLSRGFRTGLPVLALPGRGAVVDAFRVDRDVGATVLGRPFGGRMEYYVGVMNGEGKNATGNADPNVLLTARIVGAPMGPVGYDQTSVATRGISRAPRVAFAVNATTNEVRDSTTSVDPATGEEVVEPLPDRRDLTFGGDIAGTWWRVSAQAESFWRYRYRQGTRESVAWGSYLLVSGLAVRDRLDISMRVGGLQLEAEPDATMPLESGFNIYLAGNHAKLQFRYGCDIRPGASRCRRHSALAQAQLWF